MERKRVKHCIIVSFLHLLEVDNMTSSANYPEFRAYLEGSNESEETAKNLMQSLTPILKEFDKKTEFSMLDVGCSDGTFSFLLYDRIANLLPKLRVTAIEPEVPAYLKFVERVKEKNLDFIDHQNITVQKFLKNNTGKKEVFDYILFSQCFYHFPKEEWGFIFEHSTQLLKKNGFISITLDSHNSEAYKLKDKITGRKAVTLEFGDLYSAEDIESFLETKNIEFEESSFPVYLFIKNDDKKLERLARHLSFLYRTYPNLILPKYEKELKNMLEESKKNGEYFLENRVKIMNFRKPYA